jgi:hypothetical protein
MKNDKIQISNRKAAFADLKDFCVFSMGPERKDSGDFLEVTKWTNGEGYDIHISNRDGDTMFHLTLGEYEAIKKCIKEIEKIN